MINLEDRFLVCGNIRNIRSKRAR